MSLWSRLFPKTKPQPTIVLYVNGKCLEQPIFKSQSGWHCVWQAPYPNGEWTLVLGKGGDMLDVTTINGKNVGWRPLNNWADEDLIKYGFPELVSAAYQPSSSPRQA